MCLRLLLICLIALTGCSRALTPNEAAFAALIHGDQIDTSRVRLVQGAPVASVTFRRKARPRVTCRERILPPVKEEIVKAKPAAVSLFNSVFFARDWYVKEYLPAWPDRLHLSLAMLFAHEMVHVWQWQNRARTGYSPWAAVNEHSASDDPYLFDIAGTPAFLDYGYEQQGAIVEEYVCCRALAPQAARTQRLHAMLKDTFPVTDLPRRGRESDVYLPWRGAEIRGICD